MPRSLDPSSRLTMVLACDVDKPKESQPRIFARTLTLNQQRKLMGVMEQMHKAESASDKISAALDAAEICLIGWENMTDPETGETDFQGDVFAEVGPPFEFFPDPHAKSFEDVTRTWLIRARSRPLSYFAKMYGEKGKQVKEDGVWLLSAQYENRIQGMNNRGPGSGG